MSWLSLVKNLDFSEVICLADQIIVSLLIRFESEPVSITYYTVNYDLSIILQLFHVKIVYFQNIKLFILEFGLGLN